MERQSQKPAPPPRRGGSSAIPIAPSRPVPVQVRPATVLGRSAMPAFRSFAAAGPGRGTVLSPAPAPAPVVRRAGFGLPNYRRNVCPHFYMTGPQGPIPVHAPHVLKTLARQEPNISRCQLRGGVHLEQGFVSDVCLGARFNQCVFYEDDLTDL